MNPNTASVFSVNSLTSRTNSAPKQASKVNYCYKLFRVKRGSDNGVTTVSVDPVLATMACRTLGGIRAVSQRVRELSLSFDQQVPPQRNRSRFVSSALRKELEAMNNQQSAQVATTA